MAILQALLMALSRRLGQLINTLFGWSTQLLFGKVARDKQLLISGMGLGSLLWLISLIGIAFPSVGTVLLALVPLPHWVEKDWVRLIMVVFAVTIPLIIGGLGLQAISSQDRPKKFPQLVRTLFRGYTYAFGLSVTLILMLFFSPFLMLPLMARRWTIQHVPLIVASQNYEQVLVDIESALVQNGWKPHRQPASEMIRLPTRILVALARNLVERYVAEKLTTLRADTLEVTLHPADLVISGPPFSVARARAILAERLAFSEVNQTWTSEANQLEDTVKTLWQRVAAHTIEPHQARQEMKRVESKRNHLDLEFEEWEVLERQQLLLERQLLDTMGKPAKAVGQEAPLPTEKEELLLGACTLGGILLLGFLAKHRSRA